MPIQQNRIRPDPRTDFETGLALLNIFEKSLDHMRFKIVPAEMPAKPQHLPDVRLGGKQNGITPHPGAYETFAPVNRVPEALGEISHNDAFWPVNTSPPGGFLRGFSQSTFAFQRDLENGRLNTL